MVSETKQNLNDQKRLQYLEKLYKDKLEDPDSAGHKLTFKEHKRRL